MVDIQSTTAAPTVASVTSNSGLTAVPATITDISQALANLTRSIQTNATPTALAADNELTLMTALGTITVTLAQQASATERQNLLQQLMNLVQAQKPLTLALQPGSPPTQAMLLIPNAPPAAPTAAQNVPPPAPPPLPSLPVPPLTVGETLPAVVLPPLSQQALPVILPGAQSPPLYSRNMPPPSATPLPPAAPLPVNIEPELAPLVLPAPLPLAARATPSATTPLVIAETSPPISAAPPPAPAATTQTISARQPPVPAANPAPPINIPPPLQQASPQQPGPPLAALLRPGNEITLRVDSIILPPPAETAAQPLLSPALPALAPNQIAATVTGTGTDGQLILKAGDAVLFVKAQATAPVGATVIATVDAPPPEPLLPLPQNAPVNFQALPQAMAALAQSDPQTLMQMVAAHLPQPTQGLPGALLFLFSAFKQGDVGGWLGGNTVASLLRAGKPDIVASLSHELSNAGQPAQDSVVGDWRAYPIPLYAQQQFHALTLYVHSDRDARKDQSAAAPAGVGKIRFLIDMRLSKLGAMQIDGFVQPKKLDMVLRSEAVLPEGLHNELRDSYIRALGAVGYTGALNFQVGRRHWMTMQRPEARGVVT